MIYDIAIIGAGIVGASTAYQLLSSNDQLKIIVLDKEDQPALHQTGHNSGVMHSGIYYKPGSYKALNCIRGYNLLTAYCEQKKIPFKKIGKLILATHKAELNQLQNIYQNGIQNGLLGLKLLHSDEIREREPNVKGLQAIEVPQTGIIDYKIVVQNLLEDVRSLQAQVRFGAYVHKIDSKKNPLVLSIECSEPVEAWFVINCGGLQCDRVAKASGLDIPYRIVPFKGNYYKLTDAKKDIVERLIYPVPNPQFPFLGIHYTRMMNGDQTLGPNAVLSFHREGYAKGSFSVQDTAAILGFPGFWKLIQKHWKTGMQEYIRNYSKSYFAMKASEMTAGIEANDLLYSGSGIRAQLVDRKGNLVEDFVHYRLDRMIHILNAPSPAATAGLAIGQQIAQWYFESVPHQKFKS